MMPIHNQEQPQQSSKQQSIARSATDKAAKNVQPPANSSNTLARTFFDSSATLNPNDILTLQRMVGNRSVVQALEPHVQRRTAVAGLPIQTKLAVGSANDKYEQEADAVAERVMQGDAATASPDGVARRQSAPPNIARRSSYMNPLQGTFSITSSVVLQRKLNEEDRGKFENWLFEKNLKKEEFQIIFATHAEGANSFDEAKGLAEIDLIDLTAQSESAKKKKIIALRQANLKKQVGKTSDEAKNLQLAQAIKELGEELAEFDTPLGPSLVPAVASLADVLFRTYDPAHHQYIMLGNSPAPLMAYIHVNEPHAIMLNLPLGGLSDPDAPIQEQTQAGREEYQKMWGAGKTIGKPLTAYFDFILLPWIKAHGKKIVVVDFISTGFSLVVVADLIKRYLTDRKLNIPVDIFAFSEHEHDADSLIMQSGHSGVVASAVGKNEKMFAKLTASKAYKKIKFLIENESLSIKDVLEADEANVPGLITAKPDYYRRLIRLITQALHQ